MGFNDLHLFDLEMPGKHVWRLITHPVSLCYRVLKGKYFAHTYFIHATAPARASSTWKAIVAEGKALDMGLIKCVGDGTSIVTWQIIGSRTLLL